MYQIVKHTYIIMPMDSSQLIGDLLRYILR
uniref:Uncharacterized protein n=1 Tax=Lepeophtheirus salmonis TaxID=72036 RepID=A0A0K2T226_LEPSM